MGLFSSGGISRRPPVQLCDSLKNAIFREWENIPQEYIKNLYETLKKRIADVLVYKGGPTTY